MCAFRVFQPRDTACSSSVLERAFTDSVRKSALSPGDTDCGFMQMCGFPGGCARELAYFVHYDQQGNFCTLQRPIGCFSSARPRNSAWDLFHTRLERILWIFSPPNLHVSSELSALSSSESVLYQLCCFNLRFQRACERVVDPICCFVEDFVDVLLHVFTTPYISNSGFVVIGLVALLSAVVDESSLPFVLLLGRLSCYFLFEFINSSLV